nr:hypothetical protein Iba_chr12dCG11210 [Ipomoea batatas]
MEFTVQTSDSNGRTVEVQPSSSCCRSCLRTINATILSSFSLIWTEDGTAEVPGAFTVGLFSCFTTASALEVTAGSEETETTPLPLFFFPPEELGSESHQLIWPFCTTGLRCRHNTGFTATCSTSFSFRLQLQRAKHRTGLVFTVPCSTASNTLRSHIKRSHIASATLRNIMASPL